MFSYIDCLRLVAKEQCGITKGTLKNADPFDKVFQEMIKWIKNTLHRGNVFRNSGYAAMKYFPGTIEYKLVILSGST